MLNLRILNDHVFDALNRAPSSSNSIELLANEAGIAWCNANAWGYLRRRRRELAFVADQTVYALGADVVELQSLSDPSFRMYSPRLVTRSEFEAIRTGLGGTLRGVWIGTVFDSVEDDVAQKVLEVYPAPTSARSVVMIYTGGWEQVDDREAAIDLPQQLEPAFVEWVRLYAMGREAKLTMLEAVERAKASPLMRDAMAREGNEVPSLPAPIGRIGMAYSRARGARYSDPNPYGPNLARPWGSA